MIRLVALDPHHELDQTRVDRVKYPLLEFIPCDRCEVELGPPIMITVPGHSLEELAPGVLRRVEELVGCRLRAEEIPG